ncbi:MAG: murein hydrolase activator EnvC family protein [Acidiferrobacter sp.]
MRLPGGRRRGGWRALPLLLVWALPVVACAHGAQGAHELAVLRREEAALQHRLDHTLRDRSAALNALRLAEDRVARVGRHLAALQQAQRADHRRLAALRATASHLAAQVRAQRRGLAAQAVAAYMMGRAGSLQILLSQQQPSTIARMLTYYRYVLAARARRLAVVRAMLRQIHVTSRAISAAQRRLARLAAPMAVQRRALEGALVRRNRALAGLTARARSGHARLLQVEARARRLTTLLRGLRRLPRVAAPMPSLHGLFAAARGRLPLPIRVTTATVRAARDDNGLGRWSGVLLPGQRGARVRAVFPGRVVYANWLRGYGLLLILENGEGYMTLYGHCQSLLQRVGDFVAGGQVIATVGDSGGFGRPGLYFDISHDGQPLNPLQWFAH